MAGRALIACSLMLIFASDPGWAESRSYREELIERARELRLADDRQWLALLHYEKEPFGQGFFSRVESEFFFLSPNGNRDPWTELEATLILFFSERRIPPRDQVPQCVFPARYLWLKKKLEFDGSQLAEQDCPCFGEWQESVNPGSITLTFPAMLLDDPPLVLGSSFLYLKKKGNGEHLRLGDASGGLGCDALRHARLSQLNAALGGSFSIFLYGEKTPETRSFERRDSWEYELDFSAEEIALLTAHIWELSHVSFRQPVVGRGGAKHLLSLLEVARPAFHFSRSLDLWWTSLDVIRALRAQEGLVEQARFQPALATQLRHRSFHADKATQRRALALAASTLDPLSSTFRAQPPEIQAKALDLAYDFLRYQMLEAGAENEVLQARASDVSEARSKLAVPDSALPPASPPEWPRGSHRGSKASLAAGWSNDELFSEMGLRLAYHDLTDPEAGYSDGIQLEFMDALLRLTEDERTRLQRVTLFDLVSLNPRNRFVKPLSWHLHVGLDRRNFSTQREPLVGAVKGGSGLTWSLGEKSLVYLLNGPNLEISREFQADYALGFGPRLGSVLYFSDKSAAQIEGAYSRFLFGDPFNTITLNLNQRYSINPNLAIKLEQLMEWRDGYLNDCFSLRLETYF